MRSYHSFDILILRRLVKHILTYCYPFTRFLLNPKVMPLHSTTQYACLSSTTHGDSPQHNSVCVTSFEGRMIVHISTWGKHRWAVSYWLQSNTSLTLAFKIATLIINSTFLLILKSHPIPSHLDITSYKTLHSQNYTELKLYFILFCSTTLFVRFWFSKLKRMF